MHVLSFNSVIFNFPCNHPLEHSLVDCAQENMGSPSSVDCAQENMGSPSSVDCAQENMGSPSSVDCAVITARRDYCFCNEFLQ